MNPKIMGSGLNFIFCEWRKIDR